MPVVNTTVAAETIAAVSNLTVDCNAVGLAGVHRAPSLASLAVLTECSDHDDNADIAALKSDILQLQQACQGPSTDHQPASCSSLQEPEPELPSAAVMPTSPVSCDSSRPLDALLQSLAVSDATHMAQGHMHQLHVQQHQRVKRHNCIHQACATMGAARSMALSLDQSHDATINSAVSLNEAPCKYREAGESNQIVSHGHEPAVIHQPLASALPYLFGEQAEGILLQRERSRSMGSAGERDRDVESEQPMSELSLCTTEWGSIDAHEVSVSSLHTAETDYSSTNKGAGSKTRSQARRSSDASYSSADSRYRTLANPSNMKATCGVGSGSDRPRHAAPSVNMHHSSTVTSLSSLHAADKEMFGVLSKATTVTDLPHSIGSILEELPAPSQSNSIAVLKRSHSSCQGPPSRDSNTAHDKRAMQKPSDNQRLSTAIAGAEQKRCCNLM